MRYMGGIILVNPLHTPPSLLRLELGKGETKKKVREEKGELKD